MKVEKRIIDRLMKIDWFSSCGERSSVSYAFPSRQLNSWSEAESHCIGSDWEEVVEDEQGRVTEYLASHYPRKFQGVWNSLVREMKISIQKVIEPKVVSCIDGLSLSREVLKCVRWDILHAAMTLQYRDCNPPDFFIRLLEVYEDGHFPCGWEGNRPGGTLLYF